MTRTITYIAGTLYVAALAYLTLSPVHILAGSRASVSLVPLRSITEQMASPVSPSHKAFELLGNSMLLVPFGALLATVMPRRRWDLVVLAGVALSTTIELLQWALPIGRSVDIDDVLLNSLGSLLGFRLGSIALERIGPGMGFMGQARNTTAGATGATESCIGRNRRHRSRRGAASGW
jgi:glycopeptide antibiotics resistance protein